MIELQKDSLVFRFPEVHPECELAVEFQRTLRVPNDGNTYPLPAGLGRFPVRHVDDYAATVPQDWLDRGGVLMPMYQSEALWIHLRSRKFHGSRRYRFAVKIATGKINAVTGERWTEGIHGDPQDYLVTPGQPWLDGYCVERSVVRQFVAMPLHRGHTAEEQITGRAEWGGLQIAVYPMKRDVFERRFPPRQPVKARRMNRRAAMGLAPGGQIRQTIYEDPYDFGDWDLRHGSRCFVHLANSDEWRRITGQKPPHRPITARRYRRAGIPWFDCYDDAPARRGASILAALRSVGDRPGVRGPIRTGRPIRLGPDGRVREF